MTGGKIRKAHPGLCPAFPRWPALRHEVCRSSSAPLRREVTTAMMVTADDLERTKDFAKVDCCVNAAATLAVRDRRRAPLALRAPRENHLNKPTATWLGCSST